MKFWQFLAFAEPDQLTGIARIAEEAGFHGVLVGDHVFFPERLASRYPYVPDGQPAFGAGTPWPDPWVAIAAMAAVTTRLQFATSVYILPLRDPLLVASSVATAAVLSGNRVALGAGAGWMREEYDQLGVDFASRGRRYDEMIDVLRTLWAGGMVEHHGEFFDFDRLEVEPAPSEPVPIYIGGESGPAMRRAARLGDGWIGTGSVPDELVRLIEKLRLLRCDAGREQLPFETMASVAALPDPDVYRRLEDQGLTGIVHWPFKYWLGESSTLEQKRAGMEQYAERVIVPLNG
jgi:probable F420-dependent oxidoreductase